MGWGRKARTYVIRKIIDLLNQKKAGVPHTTAGNTNLAYGDHKRRKICVQLYGNTFGQKLLACLEAVLG